MSEKKHKKSLEELCRSRVSRTAATSEMWSVSQKSSHRRLFRSPSPRASCSRSRRRSENTRHSFLVSRPPSTEFIPGTSAMQHSAAHEGEKRTKKPFFPGIPSQVMTHADPPFAGTDTQPLPPINMPKGGQDGSNSSKLGKDNRPFTVYGQMPFEGGVAYDIIFAANQERAAKRKLEAMKRPEEQDRHEWHNFDVSGQPMDSEHCGKKKCGAIQKGRRAGKFSKPLAWKSPWPSQDGGGDADSDTEWDDIN